MIVTALLALGPTAAAAPELAELRAAWSRDAAAIAADGTVPLALEASDLEALSRGGTVSRRLDTADGAFALGAAWLEAPIAAAWIAAQDAKDRPLSTGMHHEWLAGGDALTRFVYMVLPLPWPVTDRQWVAEFRVNRALYEATDGRVWQRGWTLADPSLAPHPDPDATWLTASTGAWTMLPAGDGTLAVFGVRTVLGGSIPPAISQTWAVSSLKGMLRGLAEKAAAVPEHYDAAHERVLRPDGVPLPPGLKGGA
jgi:hypothetical protein